MPNVAAALRDRKPLRILAIGAAGGRRGARGTALIEKLLEQANKGLDVVIFDRGVSGNARPTPPSASRIEVALTEAGLALWQIGTNDALGYVPLEDRGDRHRDAALAEGTQGRRGAGGAAIRASHAAMCKLVRRLPRRKTW